MNVYVIMSFSLHDISCDHFFLQMKYRPLKILEVVELNWLL
jgi:hypothetical protein